MTKNDQRFVYNGYLQVANYHLSSTNYHLFVWDPTEPVATRPLVWRRSALGTPHSALFYAHDGNKNVSEVLASDGSLAAHYEYAPFGALTVSRGTSAEANPWRFSSEYAEDDTATVYYNYRHYEPVMGRWLARDPVGEDMTRCLYSLLSNDGLNNEDQLGLIKIKNKEKCPGEGCANSIQQIATALAKTKILSTDRRKEILQAVASGGWSDAKGWKTDSGVGDKIRALRQALLSGHVGVECCYNEEACKARGPEGAPAAVYRRTVAERGSGYDLDTSKLADGTIYLCNTEKLEELGGCGCAIVHELIHKLGLFADEAEYAKEDYKKDKAVVRITQMLLNDSLKGAGFKCKGYGLDENGNEVKVGGFK